jgi:hypothetical protein
VVTAALNVEGDEVEAAGADGPFEQVILDVRNKAEQNFLED